MKKTLRNSFISFFLIISILTPSIVLAFVAADTLPPVPVSDAGLRQKSLGLITVFGITIPGISLDGLMIAFARAEVDKITNSKSSDVSPLPKIVNSFMLHLLKIEAWLFEHFDLPFGTSVIVLAQKRP